jgi:hypothetical protein
VSLLLGRCLHSNQLPVELCWSAPFSLLQVPFGWEMHRDPWLCHRHNPRVQYLLQNWDLLTSVCGKGVMSDAERRQVVRTEGGGGGFCEKTPLVVQEYMGYKSTEDPLYRADKLMVRAAPLVDNAVLEDYLDVVERYREKADNVAMMAYTSSWGEANPNGGKEIVDDYLEKTKMDVQESEKLLKAVLDFLNLSILPPSKGKL